MILADTDGVGVGAAAGGELAASRSATADLFDWFDEGSEAANIARDLIFGTASSAPSAAQVPITTAKIFSLATGVRDRSGSKLPTKTGAAHFAQKRASRTKGAPHFVQYFELLTVHPLLENSRLYSTAMASSLSRYSIRERR